MMEQRTEENLSPYRTFSRAEWAVLREDTPLNDAVGHGRYVRRRLRC